ncbi:MAG: hypothetical protein ACP5K5_01970 [Candidatus Micrarchaeia archaeon]
MPDYSKELAYFNSGSKRSEDYCKRKELLTIIMFERGVDEALKASELGPERIKDLKKLTEMLRL